MVPLVHPQKNTGHVPGKDLQRAMNGLRKSLGTVIVDLIVLDLEKQGIALAGGSSYHMKQVEDALKKTFGQEGGQLRADNVRKALEKL